MKSRFIETQLRKGGIDPNMLELKGIKKDYLAGENTVHALKGIDPVSYTHLDVYKRQFLFLVNAIGTTS